MAEFKLSYTAEEINNKLGGIDTLNEQVGALEESMAGVINDEIASAENTWSSNQIIKQLCPVFTDQNTMVRCYPVQNSYMFVVSLLGDSLVFHCGKNLLDYNGFDIGENVISGITFTRHADGRINLAGTATRAIAPTLGEIILPPGTYTYDLHYNYNNGIREDGAFYGQLWTINEDGSLGDKLATKVGCTSKSATFTLTKDTTVRARIYVAQGVELGADRTIQLRPQIEVGEVSTFPEEPKVESIPREYMTHDCYGYDGVNYLYVIPSDDNKMSVSCYSDPRAIFEQLTNAIISLGGNV